MVKRRQKKKERARIFPIFYLWNLPATARTRRNGKKVSAGGLCGPGPSVLQLMDVMCAVRQPAECHPVLSLSATNPSIHIHTATDTERQDIRQQQQKIGKRGKHSKVGRDRRHAEPNYHIIISSSRHSTINPLLLL